MIERTNKVNFATPPPNTVRLIHIQRRRNPAWPCDVCGKACNKPTHWRVRAHLRFNDESEVVLAHGCAEKCAREMYDQLRVEISLITGTRPEIQKYKTE